MLLELNDDVLEHTSSFLTLNDLCVLSACSKATYTQVNQLLQNWSLGNSLCLVLSRKTLWLLLQAFKACYEQSEQHCVQLFSRLEAKFRPVTFVRIQCTQQVGTNICSTLGIAPVDFVLSQSDGYWHDLHYQSQLPETITSSLLKKSRLMGKQDLVGYEAFASSETSFVVERELKEAKNFFSLVTALLPLSTIDTIKVQGIWKACQTSTPAVSVSDQVIQEDYNFCSRLCLSNTKKLRKVEFATWPFLSVDDLYLFLSNNAETLEELVVSMAPNFCLAQLHLALQGRSKLTVEESIDLDNVVVLEDSFYSLETHTREPLCLPKLSKLHITTSAHAPLEFFQTLATSAPSLTNIHLGIFHPESFDHPSLQCMHLLDLNDFWTFDASDLVCFLSTCKRIKKLELCGAEPRNDFFEKSFAAKFIQSVVECNKLESLVLSSLHQQQDTQDDTAYSPTAVLHLLKSLPDLKFLAIPVCPVGSPSEIQEQMKDLLMDSHSPLYMYHWDVSDWWHTMLSDS